MVAAPMLLGLPVDVLEEVAELLGAVMIDDAASPFLDLLDSQVCYRRSVPPLSSLVVPIEAPGHVSIARGATRNLATAIGFDRRVAAELMIVASELATNIIKYGVRGQLMISAVDDEVHGRGLGIVAEDCGPPLRNLSWALQDGYDDHGPIDPHKRYGRRGLGTGLGAVVRLTDGLEYVEAPPLKRIQVVRYLARNARGKPESPAPPGGRRGP